MSKVVFLDYDGVVNTMQWEKRSDGTWHPRMNLVSDGVVNDVQSVQWVSEFCEKNGYDVVVTSTWRLWRGYEDALRKAGLRKGIKILGCTKDLSDNGFFQTRGRKEEIIDYLDNHRDIEEYLIFDNDYWSFDCSEEIAKHLVLCRNGFHYREYSEAQDLRTRLYGSVK